MIRIEQHGLRNMRGGFNRHYFDIADLKAIRDEEAKLLKKKVIIAPASADDL